MSGAQVLRAYVVIGVWAVGAFVALSRFLATGELLYLLVQTVCAIFLVVAVLLHMRARDIASAAGSKLEENVSASHPAARTIVPAPYVASNRWEVTLVEQELTVLLIDLSRPGSGPRKTSNPIKLVRAHWHDDLNRFHVLHAQLPSLGEEHERACAIKRAIALDVVSHEPDGWAAIAEYFNYLADSTPQHGEAA